MAGEILAARKRKGTKGFMRKVDLTKAYDFSQWGILLCIYAEKRPSSRMGGLGQDGLPSIPYQWW